MVWNQFACLQILEGKSKLTSISGMVIQGREYLEAVLDVCGRNLKKMRTRGNSFSGIDRDMLLQSRVESLSMEDPSVETVPFLEYFCRTLKDLTMILWVATFGDMVECLGRLARALKAGKSQSICRLRIRFCLHGDSVEQGGAARLLKALNDVLSCIPNVKKLEMFFLVRTNPDIDVHEVIEKIGLFCPKLTNLNVSFNSREFSAYWYLFANPEFLPLLRELTVSCDFVAEFILNGQVKLRQYRPLLSIVHG